MHWRIQTTAIVDSATASPDVRSRTNGVRCGADVSHGNETHLLPLCVPAN